MSPRRSGSWQACVLSGLIVLALPATAVWAQASWEYLGLANHDITSLGIYSGIVAVGCDSQGVFWQVGADLPPAGWHEIDLEGLEVQAVYPHKSGPLGWAIASGVSPPEGDSTFVYCSFLGEPPEPISEGILTNLTHGITGLSGFPDPTVCGETYAAGGRGLYRRLFGSEIWTPVYVTTIEGNIQTVKAHDDDPGVVLAGGSEGFAGWLMIKSVDFGDTWQILPIVANVIDLDFRGPDAETIFAAIGDRVRRSLDGGQNWVDVFVPPPSELDIITEVLLARASQRVYIAGTSTTGESPLFFSDDLGESWHHVATPFTGAIVGLALDFEENLYLAHETAGVFRIDLHSVDVEPPENGSPARPFELQANYPNPFNPGTHIDFTMLVHARAVMEIHDMRGQLVRRLFAGVLDVGPHTLSWDGQSDDGQPVPSGVYLYNLEVEGRGEGRPLLLIR